MTVACRTYEEGTVICSTAQGETFSSGSFTVSGKTAYTFNERSFKFLDNYITVTDANIGTLGLSDIPTKEWSIDQTGYITSSKINSNLVLTLQTGYVECKFVDKSSCTALPGERTGLF